MEDVPKAAKGVEGAKKKEEDCDTLCFEPSMEPYEALRGF